MATTRTRRTFDELIAAHEARVSCILCKRRLITAEAFSPQTE